MKTDWIINHFENFVFPALDLVKSRIDKSRGYGIDPINCNEISEHDPMQFRPTGRALGLPIELRMLSNAMDSMFKLPVEGDTHKFIIASQIRRMIKDTPIDKINDAVTSLKSIMKDLGFKKIFFPGRDTWLYAVCCERRQIPYEYDPSISRASVCSHLFGDYIKSKNLTESLIFDTGFMGTIPRAISDHLGRRIPFTMHSSFKGVKSYHEKISSQIHPRRTGSRGVALDIERSHKYFESCHGYFTHEDGKIIPQQFLVDDESRIMRTAIQTSIIYRDIREIKVEKEVMDVHKRSYVSWLVGQSNKGNESY